MITAKRGDGQTITITEEHWKSLQKHQAIKTLDPTQIYKKVEAEQKQSKKPKTDKS